MGTTIFLDGEVIRSEAAFHEVIATASNWHFDYGRNLDALWDVLSYVERPVRISWRNAGRSKEGIGAERFEKIVQTLTEASIRFPDDDFRFKLEM